MSRVLKFDKKFYGDDGLLSLYRGDDWDIYGTVVDRVNGYETLVDLSQYGVTGYFPSATGGSNLPASAVTGSCGLITVSMPAASTPFVQTNTGGEGAYLILEDSMGRLQTVPTIDQAIAILDRCFSTG